MYSFTRSFLSHRFDLPQPLIVIVIDMIIVVAPLNCPGTVRSHMLIRRPSRRYFDPFGGGDLRFRPVDAS